MRLIPSSGCGLFLALAALAPGCGPPAAPPEAAAEAAKLTAPPPPGKPPITKGKNKQGPARPQLFVSHESDL